MTSTAKARPLTERDLTRLLDERGIPYELYRHKAIFSGNEPIPPQIPRPEFIIKNLLMETANHAQRYLAVLRLADRADLKRLARELGVGHLGFVPGDQMEGLIGVRPGSATPFALLNDPGRVVCVMERSLLHTPVCCHPLHNEASVELAADDLTALLTSAGVPLLVADFAKTA